MRYALVLIFSFLLITPFFSTSIQAKNREDIRRGIVALECIPPANAAKSDNVAGTGFLIRFEDRPWLVSSEYFLINCADQKGIGVAIRYQGKTYKVSRISPQNYWRIFLGEIEAGCDIPEEHWLEMDATAMHDGDIIERSIPDSNGFINITSHSALMNAMPYYAPLQLRDGISDGNQLPYIYVTEVTRPWDGKSQIGAPIFSGSGQQVVGMQIRPFEGGPGSDYHLLIMPIHHLLTWLTKNPSGSTKEFELQTFVNWSQNFLAPKTLQKGHDVPSYERVQYGYAWLIEAINKKDKADMEQAANFLYKALNGIRFMAWPDSVDQSLFLERVILALTEYYATQGDFEGCMNAMELADDLAMPGRVQHQMIRIQRAYSSF